MRNLINILDLSVEEIDGLVRLASDIIDNPEVYAWSGRQRICIQLRKQYVPD